MPKGELAVVCNGWLLFAVAWIQTIANNYKQLQTIANFYFSPSTSCMS